MAKNPLEQLLKRDPREVPASVLSPEALQPYTQRGGSFQTPVQQTATNKTLAFLDQFQKGLSAFSGVVDETQRVAEKQVAEMDDAQFDKAYNELIGGDKQIKNIFGYNKAFQEKMVEQVYKRVVPDEILELKQNFESRISEFNDVNEYNDAVNKTIDEYYSDLGQRFNKNPFAQAAHNVLQLQTKSKLKEQLNSAYIQKAKQYIEGSAQSELVELFDYFKDEYDGESFKASLNTSVARAAANLNGDKIAANKMAREAVKQNILGKIATGQIANIEEAEDLFHAVFNDAEPLKVGGKDIFETLEGRQLERDLRVQLHNARITAPQILDSKVKRNVAELVVGIMDAQGDEKVTKLEEAQTTIDAIKDPQERLKMQLEFNKMKEGDLIDRDAVYQELLNDIKRASPDSTNFGKNETLSIIDDIELNDRQQSIFYDYSQGVSGTRIPTPVFNNLEPLHRTFYAQELRKLQKPIVNNASIPFQEKLTLIEEARLKAKEVADSKLTSHISDLVNAEQPAQVTNELIDSARNAGVSDRAIKTAQFLLGQGKPDQAKLFLEPYIEKQTEAVRRETTSKVGDRNKLSIGKFDDAFEVIDTYTQAFNGGALNDTDKADAFFDASNFVSKDKRTWSTIAELYSDGQRQSAAEQLYELYSVKGFSIEELEKGFVSHTYTDEVSVGAVPTANGGVVPLRKLVKREVHIPVSVIMAQNVDGAGNIRANEWNKVPIRFSDNMPYVNADYARASKALGIPESTLVSQQRSYYKAVGVDEQFDAFLNRQPTEKKSNEVDDDDIIPTVRGNEPDLDTPSANVRAFKDRYNMSEGKTISYREFAEQFYKEYTNIPPEEIEAGLDEKFKAMENRPPGLLKTISKPVKISFEMSSKDQEKLLGYYKPLTHTMHLNPNISVDEMASVLMHELIHSAQFKNSVFAASGTNIYTDKYVLNRLRNVNSRKDYVGYLKSEHEAEARVAEVGRAFAELTGTFIKPNDTKTAMEALVWFLSTDLNSELSPRLAESYAKTSSQLFRILDLKPDDYFNPEEQGSPMDKEKLRKDLKAIPNINLILESISTLASKDSNLNPNQQLA